MSAEHGVRHVLEIDDLSADELSAVLDAAEKPAPPSLAGRGVALIFEKPSLRTRNASEMAVVQLGGHPVAIFDAEIGLDRRESCEDIARVLAGYYAVLAARVNDHRKLERMAAVSPVPVVNLLSDTGHPCQALADLLTTRQRFGGLAGLSCAWIGDFNNVARSLALGALLSGASIRIACPDGYGPTDADRARLQAAARGGAAFDEVSDPVEAVAGASMVSTDVWVSMGQEAEVDARRRAFARFQVDDALMAAARSDAVFLHCLPARRGEEVAASVIDGPQSLVIAQAHNRMHAFRGLLAWLVR